MDFRPRAIEDHCIWMLDKREILATLARKIQD